VAFPTPWNQLEAGILFALDVPLLVFRDHNVSGGIFDNGVTDLFIHSIPKAELTKENQKAFREVIRRWSTKVQDHYYRK